MEIKGRYFYNSIFTLETEEHFFVFDYYPYEGEPRQGGLAAGQMEPREFPDKKVLVFSSHSHSDHYHPVIFSWRDTVPGIRYILSDEIKIPAGLSGGDILQVKAGGEYEVEGITVKALRSTDLGAAFFIRVQGITLYHGGDLNWWAWTGKSEQYNREMEARYKKEIDSLGCPEIDLAFVPLDGRLEENYGLGLDYFMRRTRTKYAVPMHFRRDYSVFRKLAEEPWAEEYVHKVLRFTGTNQEFLLTI